MNWSAAILAGGQARRLGGQDKSALIVDGVRFIDRQIAALRPLTDRIVLVGYRGSGPAPLPVEIDRWPGTGALGALGTALSVAQTDRVLVLACDLPFVTTEFLAFLAAVDRAATAVIPVWHGQWQPLCAMYARRAASPIAAAIARGDRGVIATVEQLEPRLVGGDELTPFDRADRLLANINTLEELARFGHAQTPPGAATSLDDVSAGDRTAASEPSQTTRR
jgi:molybdopterin-guanine dinucleotide biosynthesis protein A